MEYTVVVSKAGGAFRVDFEKSAEVLCELVGSHLAKGWVPQGGVCFVTGPSGQKNLLQALTREGRRGQ